MASEDILRKRIDKILAHVNQQQQPMEEISIEEFAAQLAKPHLLSDQEQKRLVAYVKRIEPKVDGRDLRIALRDFTAQELSEFSLWCKLGTALDQEDIEAAAKYRRYLFTSIEQLIAQFMSIDEQRIPVNLPHNQKQYRFLKSKIERSIADNRSLTGDIDDIRFWCDTFAAQAV